MLVKDGGEERGGGGYVLRGEKGGKGEEENGKLSFVSAMG